MLSRARVKKSYKYVINHSTAALSICFPCRYIYEVMILLLLLLYRYLRTKYDGLRRPWHDNDVYPGKGSCNFHAGTRQCLPNRWWKFYLKMFTDMIACAASAAELFTRPPPSVFIYGLSPTRYVPNYCKHSLLNTLVCRTMWFSRRSLMMFSYSGTPPRGIAVVLVFCCRKRF